MKSEKLEKQNSVLEIQLKMVKDEQSKLVNNFYDLENRYKDIIQENKWIKNEILDLRKNRTELKNSQFN